MAREYTAAVEAHGRFWQGQVQWKCLAGLVDCSRQLCATHALVICLRWQQPSQFCLFVFVASSSLKMSP